MFVVGRAAEVGVVAVVPERDRRTRDQPEPSGGDNLTMTEIPVEDPTQLPGFTNIAGISVVALGEDFDNLVAIGHYDPTRVVAAFTVHAYRDLGWDAFVGGAFTGPGDAVEQVERQWARFVRVPVTEDGIVQPNAWRIDYYSDERPGTVPITTLDCS